MSQKDEAIIKELTSEEGFMFFDEEAQGTLGISGKEFLVRLKAGKIGDPNDPKNARLIMLLPFATDAGAKST